MKILCKLLLIFLLSTARVFAADVFSSPSTARDVMESLPEFKNIQCKFIQTKTMPNSQVVLKSGGDFVFNKDKGVIFYTKYPVVMTTSYDRNERINKIISAVINKNYNYLNKNFKFYYRISETDKGKIWELGLIPVNSQIKSYIKSIYLSGNIRIKQIEIKSVDGVVTKINFKGGK